MDWALCNLIDKNKYLDGLYSIYPKRFISTLKYVKLFLLIALFEACETHHYTQEQLDSLKRREIIQELITEWQEKKQEGREKRTARNQAGDTLAIDAAILKSFLPKSFKGYQSTEDFSEMPYEASGEAYSSVEQTYLKGNSHLRITLSDYNGQESKLAESTAIWNVYPGTENTSQSAKGLKMHKSMVGWEIYLKNSRRAELMLAVSDRILLTIIADQQKDTEFIKSIAEAMDLPKLAAH